MSISSVASDSIQINDLNLVQEPSTVSLKDYVVEVCKRHAFFIVEIPRIFAEIAFRSGFGGEVAFRGLEVPVKLEYWVFLMEDAKTLVNTLVETPKRVFEVIQRKAPASGLITPIRSSVANVASFISSWADVQSFFEAIGEVRLATANSDQAVASAGQFSALVGRLSVIPKQLGNVSSMIASGNRIYDWATNQLNSQKAMANEKNLDKAEIARKKDAWETAKNASIFALSTMFFTAGLIGATVSPVLSIACSAGIITSRMASFREELKSEYLGRMAVAVKQADEIVKN